MRLKLVRDLFTERDGATWDAKRIVWAVGVVWFMALETYAVGWKGLVFDPQATAIGLSGLIAAGGAALAMNRKNENGCDPKEGT